MTLFEERLYTLYLCFDFDNFVEFFENVTDILKKILGIYNFSGMRYILFEFVLFSEGKKMTISIKVSFLHLQVLQKNNKIFKSTGILTS